MECAERPLHPNQTPIHQTNQTESPPHSQTNSQIIVYDDARYRERKESNGLFAAIPAILKTLGSGSRGGGAGGQLALPAGGMSDAYRDGPGGGGYGSPMGGGGGGPAAPARGGGYLPSNYTYEQWQQDLRRWEAETGMTYDQYLRTQGGPAGAGARAALPPAGAGRGGGAYGGPQQGGYPQAARGGGGGAYGQQARGAPAPTNRYPPQQQQPGGPQQQQRPPPQQQQRPGAYGQQAGPGGRPGGPGGAPGAAPGWSADPRQRPAPPAGGPQYGAAPGPQQQQQQQQQQQPPRGYAAAAPPQGYRPAARPAPAGGAPAAGPPASSAAPPSSAGPAAGSAAATAGRPVDEWLDKDVRPRVQEVLAEGAVPLGGGGGGGASGGGGEGVTEGADAAAGRG